MNDTPGIVYVARLIGVDGPRQTMEFEALDDRTAWRQANDGIDPLAGLWVEVTRKADSQQPSDLQWCGDSNGIDP